MRQAHNSRSQRMKARYLTLPAVALVLSACATKSDVATLRRDMGALQQRQDQAIQQLMQQNQQMPETLRHAMALQRDAAGVTSHRCQPPATSLARVEGVDGGT